MTLCTNNFEGGVNGNTIATTDTGSGTAWDLVGLASSGTAVYSNTHPAFGALAGKVSNAGSAGIAWLQWSTALGTVTDHYGRAYLWLSAVPTTDDCCILRMLNAAFADVGRIYVTAAGKLKVAADVGATSTASVSTGQLVRVEWHFVHNVSTGSVEAKLFNTASDTSPTETINTGNTNSGADAAYIRIGVNADGNNFNNNMSIWMDQLVAGDTAYPGPFSGQTAPFANVTVTA